MKRKTHYFSKDESLRLIENECFLERKLAFQFGYDTGARAGEIVKISAEHIRAQDMTLWDSKKSDWKIVPLSVKTMTMLAMYLNQTKIRAKLFDITTKTLNNWIHDACTREHITADLGTRIRWHSWRGTFVREHRDLGDKWLMQTTGDSYQTLLEYYQELSNADLVRMKNAHI